MYVVSRQGVKCEVRDNVLVPESLEGAKHKQGVALKEHTFFT